MAPVSVTLEWNSLGEVRLDDTERLVFPETPQLPGLYKFDLALARKRGVYVGESDQLPRRFQHYRTPGPSQRTNLRLSARMVEHIRSGNSVRVSVVVDEAMITIGTHARPVDLTDKAERVLLEHAALISEQDSGAAILNA